MGLLDSLFGRKKTAAMPFKVAAKIVQDYGAMLMSTGAPPPGCFADVRKLPYAKDRIKEAIAFALGSTPDPQIREHLKIAYLSLADWQEGVGDTIVGIDTSPGAMGSDPRELAARIASQATELQRWKPKADAERAALATDLSRFGL